MQKNGLVLKKFLRDNFNTFFVAFYFSFEPICSVIGQMGAKKRAGNFEKEEAFKLLLASNRAPSGGIC